MDSDSDLQAYINQITRKTQDLKFEVDVSSDSVATPTDLSSSDEVPEINDKKTQRGNGSPQKIIDDPKSSKIKFLQQKYMKKPLKVESESEISFSISQEGLSNVGKAQKTHTQPLSTLQKSHHSQNDTILKVSEINDLAVAKEDGLERLKRASFNEIDDSPIEELEESEKHPFYASEKKLLARRKSSASLLLTKDSVFFSSSISTDKNKPKPLQKKSSILKFAKYDSKASTIESNSILTDRSVEEELSPLSYDKTSGGDKPERSDQPINSRELDRKETDFNNDQPVNKPDRIRQINERSIRQKSKSEEYSSSERKVVHYDTPSEDRGSYSKGRDSSIPDIDRRADVKRKDKRNKHGQSDDRRGKESVKNKENLQPSKKYEKEKRRSSRHQVCSSESSSSIASSSSFSVRLKRKNYKKMKKKSSSRDDERIAESVVKALTKLLPILLEKSYSYHPHCSGFYDRSLRVNSGCRDWCVDSNNSSWIVANSRIDDALRQSISLTRQFLETHRKFIQMETQQSSNFQYTFLKKY